MTPEQKQAQVGNQCNVVQTPAGGSIRYQRVKLLNLEKLTALGWIINRGSARPLAKQEVRLHKHSNRKRVYRRARDQESCDLSGGCRATHIICLMCFQIARRTNFVALPFLSVFVVCKRLKNLDGSSPIFGAVKSTSLSRHTCHRTSSTRKVSDGFQTQGRG